MFLNIVQDIDLAQLHTFGSPTSYSTFDTAWIAFLTIETANQTYKSKPFDRGRPMKEFKQLVDLIETYIPKK